MSEKIRLVVEVEWGQSECGLLFLYDQKRKPRGYVVDLWDGSWKGCLPRDEDSETFPTLAEAKRWVEDQIGERVEPEEIGIGMSDKSGVVR